MTLRLRDVEEKSAAAADIENFLWRREVQIQVLHAANVELEIFFEIEILRVMPPARRRVRRRISELLLSISAAAPDRPARAKAGAESDAASAACAATSDDRSAAGKACRVCARASRRSSGLTGNSGFINRRRAKIFCGRGPIRKAKVEAAFAQSCRNYASAFQHQLRLGPHKKRANFQHPLRCR